ncbi:MAG: hypothetical protein RJQ09_03645 [Cyclobacteriaceae bacterium]
MLKYLETPKQDRQFLKINPSKKRLSGLLHTFIINDHDHYVKYIPSLNLSAYGDTKEELEEMMQVCLEEYLDAFFDLSDSEMQKELSKYGWEREKLFRKRYFNNSYVDKEGILQNFNLPAETEISESQIAV